MSAGFDAGTASHAAIAGPAVLCPAHKHWGTWCHDRQSVGLGKLGPQCMHGAYHTLQYAGVPWRRARVSCDLQCAASGEFWSFQHSLRRTWLQGRSSATRSRSAMQRWTLTTAAAGGRPPPFRRQKQEQPITSVRAGSPLLAAASLCGCGRHAAQFPQMEAPALAPAPPAFKSRVAEHTRVLHEPCCPTRPGSLQRWTRGRRERRSSSGSRERKWTGSAGKPAPNRSSASARAWKRRWRWPPARRQRWPRRGRCGGGPQVLLAVAAMGTGVAGGWCVRGSLLWVCMGPKAAAQLSRRRPAASAAPSCSARRRRAGAGNEKGPEEALAEGRE